MRVISTIFWLIAGFLTTLILLSLLLWTLNGPNVLLPGLGLIVHVVVIIFALLIVDAIAIALAVISKKLFRSRSG